MPTPVDYVDLIKKDDDYYSIHDTELRNTKGQANGLASLGSDGKVPSSQLPNIGGGHVIEESNGTDMTQRANLQFVDAILTDDSTNDRTIVENVHVIDDEDELDNLPDGIYIGDYDDTTPIDASVIAYDNTDSGLSADNVQDAIDELANETDRMDTTTTSASGNPISITGLKSNQLAIDPVITFEPIQSGSGTPSPENVRAISGYDKVEVGSCGKNLFDISKVLVGTASNGVWTLPATLYSPTTYDMKFKANTQYTFSGYEQQSAASKNVRLMVFYTDSTTANVFADNGTTKTAFTFTSALDKTIERLSLTFGTALDSPTVAISELQIEEGSTATTYEPYKSATSISEALGQTVYWGELDVRSGKFKVIGKIIDLGDLTWIYNSTYDKFYAQTVTDALKAEGKTCVCSRYLAVDNISSIAGTMPDKSINMMSDASNPNSRIFLYDTDYTDGGALQTALAGTQFVYKLATPFTIQLTPHEISLLKTYAYISTNGNNIQLSYHNGEMASLGDVAQVAEYGRLCAKDFIATPNANGRITLGTITDMIPIAIIDTKGIGYGALRHANNDINYWYANIWNDAGTHPSDESQYRVYGIKVTP